MQVIVEKGAQAGIAFRLHDGINTLGREVKNRIRLRDQRVSRNHCKIRKVGETLFIIDLGTRNGTLVNGNLISKAELKTGDRIRIGNTVLRIVEEEYNSKEASEKQHSFLSFFHHFSMIFPGQRRDPDLSNPSSDFAKLSRRSRYRVWKPKRDTGRPPDWHQTTLD